MAPEPAVLGGGSWGTALALQLCRGGARPRLWVHDPKRAADIDTRRENRTYLAGHPLPDALRVTASLEEALTGATEVLVVVPSHHCRAVFAAARPFLAAPATFLLASKGIETETLMRVSQILADVLGEGAAARAAVLSGPSFAREVAAGHPTAVVAASPDRGLAERYQRLLSAEAFRVYTNVDIVGVELGGALKNVIAIGAGAVEGLGFGTNTLAALITRGLAEISRLAEALGGRRETLAGLAGLGDLVLTCTGALSRNRALGVALGKGETLERHQAGTPMIAEGVRTTLSAQRLAARHGVTMPITGQVHALLYEGKPVREAIQDLLARELTEEGR